MVVLVHLLVSAWWLDRPPCLQAHMALSWGDAAPQGGADPRGSLMAEKIIHALLPFTVFVNLYLMVL